MFHPLDAWQFAGYWVYGNPSVGWIGQKSAGGSFDAFYCNGKQKLSAVFGSMNEAQLYIARLVASYGSGSA